MFDAERHDVHSGRVGVVVVNDLLRFNLTTGQYGVAATDDSFFFGGPLRRGLTKGGGLHSIEGVESHDEGNAELVL